MTPAGFAHRVSDGKWVCPPHLDLLNRKLMGVATGQIRRLLICMPPRHGKSEFASKYFPAWFLGNFPDRRVILTSYEADFATDWGRKVRDILQEHGREYFGVSVRPDTSAANRWNLVDHAGGMNTAGVGGPITGKGAHLLLIDDPVKNAEEAASATYRAKAWDWYTSTAYTRLEPGAAIILIQCMTGDTPVLMADGTEKPLSDVRVGDAVASYDKGRLSASKVLNWKKQGPDHIFTIRMSSGITVRANKRHPFLVERNGNTEWVRLKNLRIGDKVLRVIGGNGAALPAHTTDATCLPSAEAIACPITAEPGGRADTGLRRSILGPEELRTCGTDTASTWASTTPSWKPRAGSVRSAASPQPPTCGRIGAANSASTTTTRRERPAVCCATTAISRSGTARRKRHCSGPLDTFEITLDRIVEIVEAGREDVFDIQVEGTENFVANGLVSHNTRWHEDDLAGRILAHSASSGTPWEVVNLPAFAEEGDILGREPGEPLWPERYDAAALRDIRETIFDRWFSALYQQHPAPDDGGVFKTDKLVNPVAAAPVEASRVRAWDFAATSAGDFTVGVKMAKTPENLFYVEDVIRGRWTPLERDRRVLQAAQMDGTRVEIVVEQEPGSAGVSVAESMVRMLAGYSVRAERATGSKETRAMPFASQVEAGNVKLIEGEWNRDYVQELATFPFGKHDDQVDGSSSAFNRLALAPVGKKIRVI